MPPVSSRDGEQGGWGVAGQESITLVYRVSACARAAGLVGCPVWVGVFVHVCVCACLGEGVHVHSWCGAVRAIAWLEPSEGRL